MFLVLGSSGVVGKYLCRHLKQKGLPYMEWDIRRTPGEDLSNSENNQRLSEAVGRSSYVFFLAYNVGGAKFLDGSCHSWDYVHDNINIMTNTLSVLQQHPRVPFTFASSRMAAERHLYGACKVMGEAMIAKHHLPSGSIVRFWNVVGDEEINEKSHVIPDFIAQFGATGKIKMMTTGMERRQMLHAVDCATALVAMAEHEMNIVSEYWSVHGTGTTATPGGHPPAKRARTDGSSSAGTTPPDEATTKLNLKEPRYWDVTSFEWVTIKQVAEAITPNVEPGPAVANSSYELDPSRDILKIWSGPTMDLEAIIKRFKEEAAEEGKKEATDI